ncbi:Uncharacterized protein Adt_33023 [Abeliophyllum distichum]|uniref:Uncharacterized protein n=1 Tax=Abeliophyllum distichum TaxID=126358 RepID=A0ABD1QV21_9LAMI
MIIDQYLNTVKLLSDNLDIAVKKILHSDLATQVLAGLDEEYTPIVVQINSRDSISWRELQSTLMTFESWLEYLNAVKTDVAGINIIHALVNFTQRHGMCNYNSRNQRQKSGGR